MENPRVIGTKDIYMSDKGVYPLAREIMSGFN